MIGQRSGPIQPISRPNYHNFRSPRNFARPTHRYQATPRRGAGFRNEGRGGATQANRRGRRSERNDAPTTDPRTRGPTVDTPVPIHQAPIITEPVIITAEPVIEPDDLSFLNDFANTNLSSNLGDDIVMDGGVGTTEGEFEA